ncbi:MAG TPA: histidine phosphatase family protein [Fimbriimonas sp.]
MTLALLALLVAAPADFTFVRHAETVANATGRYNSKTLNALSDKGQKQVSALTRELLGQPDYDLVLVSPSPRALKTIAPYLKAKGIKATVWPLLYECCTGRQRTSKATRFDWGPRVSIPKELAAYFLVQPGMDRLPNAPNFGAGLAQVAATVKEFKASYSNRRVLLVGHSGHGGQFLYALTGKRHHVKNAETIAFRF